MDLQLHTDKIFIGVEQLIIAAQKRVAVFVNAETTLLYWSIVKYINTEIKNRKASRYGTKILATLSQQLTQGYGKGYTYTAITRMCKVAEVIDEQIIATVSQSLSWSHLIELATIEDPIKRDFYTQLTITEKWGVRQLRTKADTMLFERTTIATKPKRTIRQSLLLLKEDKTVTPELVFKNSYVLNFLNLPTGYSESDLEEALLSHLQEFIMELGNGFAFLEKQKRIPVDSIDYHLDLLFYHRKLKRLVAIDLKLGKFKPKYKAQMELYLRWLQKNEMQQGEETPIGLLLCSEGNTEHIEYMMLNEKEIKVAHYLTELPSKKWFADKLHRAIEISKMNESK
jgi:predicted nuclease of restriction endonuclease-like (RecB) superfamily